VKTKAIAFVSAVYFPAERPGGLSRAWLQLRDDADDHLFRIAVPLDFCRDLTHRLEALGEEEELTVTLTIEVEEEA